MNKEEKKEGFAKVVDFFSKLGTKVEVTEVVENRAAKLVAFAKDKENEESKLDKFEELNLLAGGLVMIEPEVEAGAAIAAQTEEGEWVPAPAGAYELEDGRIVNVVEDGLVDSVTEQSADGEVEEPVVEEEMESNSPKRVIESIVKEKIFAKQDEFEALQKENKFLIEANEEKTESFKALETKFEELMQFAKERFEELYSEPVKEPAVKTKNPFKTETKNIFLKQNTNNKN